MTTIAASQAQMGLANNQREAQHLQEKARDITSLKDSNIPHIDKDKKLRKACEGFETIFVKKMWEEMQDAVQKSDFLTSRDEKHWRGMYNQELAEVMTSAGGIGLADMMYRQLSGDLANASRATIATSFSENSTGFELKPVPLINSSDIGQSQTVNRVGGINEQMLANIQVAGSITDVSQNNKSMYSGAVSQPNTPNLSAIHNQSVQNAHDAIASMNTKNLTVGNSGVIQNVLTQLKSQKIGTSNLADNAKATSQVQNSAANHVYAADGNSKQQNHILSQGVNAQPERNNVYTEPVINKLSGGAVLPSANTYASTENTNRVRLPKQSGINQAQVHGSPGISPSKYINNSPFVVRAPTVKSESQDNVVADKQTQDVAQAQTPKYILGNAQVNQLGEVGQTLTRQNFNILPSERKIKNI